jgi:hypothetical protein
MDKIRQYKWLIVLIILSIISLKDLFHPGLFLAHDSPDHVARIANFYQNLADGNFIPRWAPNLNWGYGHPILMFLYPLSSYIASFFHFLGFSLVDSAKIVFGLGFTLSGITMYLWIRELWAESDSASAAGFVSGLLYMFVPYRFVDIYVRGAIGENFFFIWPPLVLYFMAKLSKKLKWKYVVGGSLSLSAMLLSHNALSLMYLPFIGFYSILMILNSNKKLRVTCYVLLITIQGFALSAFFWLPAFFEGKYTLRDIVTGGEIFSRFETLKRLLYSPWNYGGTGQFSVQLGILQWILVLVVPTIIFYLYKSKKLRFTIYDLRFTILAFITFWLSIFLILPISKPIYHSLTILQKFQFPWRWLSLAIFPPAIFAGALVYLIPDKIKLRSHVNLPSKFYVVTCYLLLVVFLNRNYWHAKGYLNKPDAFYSGIYYGTTDTGESAPIWSVRFMEREPKVRLEVIEGKAVIKQIQRKSTEHIYRVNIRSNKARLVENTLYFPGWVVYIDGKKVPLYDLWWQDPNYRGLMTFFVSKGEHEIIVKFSETKLRLFADIITLISLIILIVILLSSTKLLQIFPHVQKNL